MNMIPYLGCMLIAPFAALLLLIGLIIVVLQKPRRWRLPLIFWAFGIVFLVIGLFPLGVLAAKGFPESLPVTGDYVLFNDGAGWNFVDPSPGDVYGYDFVEAYAFNDEWMLIADRSQKIHYLNLETGLSTTVANPGSPRPQGVPENAQLKGVGSHYWHWLLLGK